MYNSTSDLNGYVVLFHKQRYDKIVHTKVVLSYSRNITVILFDLTIRRSRKDLDVTCENTNEHV